MRQDKTPLFFLLFCVVLAACSSLKPQETLPSNQDLVNTIVKGTMQAVLSATPVPTGTPTITPTPTLPLPVPPGWGVYWNEEFGFAFSHPTLFNCHNSFDYPDSDEKLVVSFLRKDTCLWGTDAVRDGVSVVIKLNSEGVSIREMADWEEKYLKQPGYLTGPDVTISEEPIRSTGKDGILVYWKNYSQGVTAFIPFPNDQRILIIRIDVEEKSDFMEAGRQILASLRFTDRSPALVSMATQTAEFFAPPAEISRVEYTDINDLLTHAPFQLWLPTYVPDGLTLIKSWMAKYADGSQQVGLTYGSPDENANQPLRQLTLVTTKTNQELTFESLFHLPDVAPDPVLNGIELISVHQQEGYFWLSFPPKGVTDVVDWRESGINFHMTFYNDWSVLDGHTDYQPRDIIEKIADSMQLH